MKKVLLLILLCSRTVWAGPAISDSLVHNLKCQNLSLESLRKSFREDAFSAKYHFPVKNWSFYYSGIKLGNCWGLTSLQRRFYYLGRFETPPSFLQFKTDVQHSEVRHFFRARNIRLLRGTAAERTARENEITIQQLIRNLKSKRLTTLVLRFSKRNQHTVLAKAYTTGAQGNLSISVYDSNQPWHDVQIIYSREHQRFYAGSVARRISSAPADGNHVGVFIVDEEERSALEDSLLRKYKEHCGSLSASANSSYLHLPGETFKK